MMEMEGENMDDMSDRNVIENQLLRQLADQQQHVEGVLQVTIEGTSPSNESDFFAKLVKTTALTLDMKYAFVCKCVDNPPTRVHSLAVWTGKKIGSNIKYDLVDTPCREVIDGQAVYHAKSIQSLYPRDKDLEKMGAECYIGYPLVSSGGKVMGKLAILDVKPLDKNDHLRKTSYMEIFAARAASELERHLVNEALKQSEKCFRVMTEAYPVGLFLIDGEGKNIYSNPAWCQMTGFTHEEALGDRWSKVIHPQDADRVFSEWRASLHDQATYERIVRCVSKEERVSFARVRIAPLQEGGTLIRYTGIAEDISDREFERSHMYREAPIGFCYLDTDLRYVHINSWLAAYNGLSVEEHLGHTLRELFPDLAEKIESQLQRVITTGQPIINGTVFVETRAHPGVKRLYEHSFYANKSEDGVVLGVSCIVADITENSVADDSLTAEWKKAIEDKKIALREVIAQAAEDKQELLDHVQMNVNHIIMPMLSKFKDKVGSAEQQYVLLLRNLLRNITSPFVSQISSKIPELSPREMEILNMIKEGMSTKEIASILNTEATTVRRQRQIIRKKLGIFDRAINLMKHLNEN